jgi:hypothetical protein
MREETKEKPFFAWKEVVPFWAPCLVSRLWVEIIPD